MNLRIFLIIILELIGAIKTNEKTFREKRNFSRVKSKEESRVRNRQDRGFLPKARNTHLPFIQHPTQKLVQPTQTDQPKLTPFNQKRNSFDEFEPRKKYNRPDPTAPRGKTQHQEKQKRDKNSQDSKRSRHRNRDHTKENNRDKENRESKKKSKSRRKVEVDPCPNAGHNEKYGCYKNIYQQGLSSNTSDQPKYFRASKCKSRRKSKKIPETCQNDKKKKYFVNAVEKKSSQSQITSAGDDPYMVFEMVTLGEHTFNQGADPVVKIGFRNVATDTWVTVDNDTVTLQRHPNNRENPDKATIFYQDFTSSEVKKGLEYYQWVGHKRVGRKSGIFLAVTNRGQFILVEHKILHVKKPRGGNGRKNGRKKVSYNWNVGAAWRKRKNDHKTRAKRGRKTGSSRDKTGSKHRENKHKYGLYFMSTQAHQSKIEEAFAKASRRNKN